MDKSINQVLVLRYNNSNEQEYIQEHKTVLQEYGHVWMLKIGRPPKIELINAIHDNGGKIVLCSPKKSNYKMYLCDVVDCYVGSEKEDLHYPEYYKGMRDEYNERICLRGTWFKITAIRKLQEELRQRLFLTSNERKVDEVIKETRTASLYAYIKAIV